MKTGSESNRIIPGKIITRVFFPRGNFRRISQKRRRIVSIVFSFWSRFARLKDRSLSFRRKKMFFRVDSSLCFLFLLFFPGCT
ncbi:hypothetical protein EHQ76_04835 [Leptospira barantonii]|uniref:Uncharacterized protein n=1 Tax=Leptospira barantonii TaxID=2023184 RepID=A0A5F2BNU3_9LEPT|nr:hypothetical protein EHQ76_04835 [Leptospira barantonii]